MLRSFGSFNPGHGPRRFPTRFAIAAVAAAGQMALTTPALAGKKEDKKKKEDPKKEETFSLDPFLNQLAGPMAQNGGVSAIFGLAAGGALKVIGKAMFVTIGLLFCLVQAASHLGYITVNWGKVHKTTLKLLDVNGDGKLDGKDLEHAQKVALAYLAEGVPSIGGFSVGFLAGLKLF